MFKNLFLDANRLRDTIWCALKINCCPSFNSKFSDAVINKKKKKKNFELHQNYYNSFYVSNNTSVL